MTKGYPKRLDVPSEEVLAKRRERKDLRQRRIAKPPKMQKKLKGFFQEQYRIPKDRKEVFEWQGANVHIRDTRHAMGTTVTVTSPVIQMTYLDWFLTHIVFPNNRGIQLFPNVKEQSESVGAMFAARKHVLDLHDHVVIVVADGTTPRTGYLISPFAKRVISVDPLMHEQWTSTVLVPNLTCEKATIEDFLTRFQPDNEKIAIVAVHAHVKLDLYLPTILPWVTTVISIPCCVPQHTTLLPQTSNILDYAIMCPCRRVIVWSQQKQTKITT